MSNSKMKFRTKLTIVMLVFTLGTLVSVFIGSLFVMQSMTDIASETNTKMKEEMLANIGFGYSQYESELEMFILRTGHAYLMENPVDLENPQPGLDAAIAHQLSYDNSLSYSTAVYFIAEKGTVTATGAYDPLYTAIPSPETLMELLHFPLFVDPNAPDMEYSSVSEMLVQENYMMVQTSGREHPSIVVWFPLAEDTRYGFYLAEPNSDTVLGVIRELMTEKSDQMIAGITGAARNYFIGMLMMLIAMSTVITVLSRKVTGVVVDPVEREKEQQDREIRRMAEEKSILEQLDRLKTEFLSNVSHELKTPLTVVSGYAQISERQLEGQAENEAARTKMKIIAAEADRLALMVGQILDVTRIEEGRMTLDKSPCRIDEIIQSAVDTHFPILNKNSNRLRLAIDSGLPRANADPARLGQVLVNLIANAVRFTRGGEITVAAKQTDGFVEVSVADTGDGIEPERLPHIFERFKSRDGDKKARTGQDTGTGLGLYICKHIVENHGGTIAVESEFGKGTTVRFTVPVAQ